MPDGHTPTGTPYWTLHRGRGKRRTPYRVLGPWPAYPGVGPPPEPPDDDIALRHEALLSGTMDQG